MNFVALVLGLAVLGAGAGFEALAIWILWTDTGWSSLAGALAGHIAAAGLCAEGLRIRSRPLDAEARRMMYSTGWVIGLCFVLFGPFVCIFLAMTSAKTRRGHVTTESLEQQRSKAAAAAQERRRAAQQLDAGLEAIVDALKDRSPEVRIAAIDALRGDESKQAVKVLSFSRENTVYDVRMRAVEGLAKISKDFGDRISAAKKALEADPNSGDRNADLAHLCLEYGGLGIEDDKMARMYVEDAIRFAEAAIAVGTNSRQVRLDLARGLRLVDRYEEAESIYRQLADEDATDADALIGIPECRFRMNQFASLPSICRWVLRQGGQKLDEASTAALKFWIQAR